MAYWHILWDLDDDLDGNVQHIAQHGITKDEVAETLSNYYDIDRSRSSGRPIAFGYTAGGRHIAVIFEYANGSTVYPVTAFDVPD